MPNLELVRKDDVSSLVQRIRRFGANALESRGMSWSLEVPEDFEARRLDPEQRRQIFLIVKEALTNVARHSRCTRAVKHSARAFAWWSDSSAPAVTRIRARPTSMIFSNVAVTI